MTILRTSHVPAMNRTIQVATAKALSRGQFESIGSAALRPFSPDHSTLLWGRHDSQ